MKKSSEVNGHLKTKNKSILSRPDNGSSKYPRHSLEKSLRIPKAILEQNAGKLCSEEEAAKYMGVGNNGPFKLEVSSSTKFGLIERPTIGKIQITDLAKKNSSSTKCAR